jgi:hypothetical protein
MDMDSGLHKPRPMHLLNFSKPTKLHH